MDEKLQQQIDDYLDGNLSEPAKTGFEAKLQADKTLANEVNLFRQMDDLLGETDVMDFSNTLDAVMGSEETAEKKETAIIRKMPTKSTNNRRWMSIAAGFALVAVLSALIYTNISSISPNTLYANNMEFPAALGGGSGLRSTDVTITNTILDQLNQQWQAANEAYQGNQYAAALAALVEIEKLDPNFIVESRDYYYFKKGLVQLKLEQFEIAIASFEQVTTGDYVTNAQWKRALALLKIDVERAKIALEEVVNAGHLESGKAEEILKQL